VGRFSSGLASAKETDFLATIAQMKRDWDQLTFPELYVGAIRLYDLGYRKEAVYWFYTAQYRGRQFGVLLDQTKMGSIGSRGFELLHAQNAFYQLVGTYINGYAFGDTDGLAKIVERVQKEGRRIADLQAAYPRVTFKNKNEWESANTELADGMNQLISMLKEKKDEIKTSAHRARDGGEILEIAKQGATQSLKVPLSSGQSSKLPRTSKAHDNRTSHRISRPRFANALLRMA
jgi:hypothetical protein